MNDSQATTGRQAIEQKLLAHFAAGDVAAVKRLVASKPELKTERGYSAHRLLRAFVKSNSGHCYKESHLRIADLLTSENVLSFRDAVIDDRVADVQAMLQNDPELIDAEFAGGRGIAQAIHHFRSVEMATVLLDAGADINARTTVHQIGDTPVGIQVRFGTPKTVEYLLERGADPNGGLLKFMRAEEMPVLVPLLLKHGWDINEGREVRTLLHHDASHGHTQKMRLLLSSGADPNVRDVDGRTPLHLVADKGTATAAIQLLIKAGADRSAKDAAGKTALDYAQMAKSNESVIRLLS